ncbi:MAG: hypothetical protein JJ953_03220 [Gracilimonas sp.]|uniref:hypothetical protein n=1 Tax=Gracilimonas TaxID=649462 RepID=UPI001B1E7530|nr:hypothetical protein [Gracilimonas sp.]MBO6585096.1 hypothetical protein [Gracilimonas sp.]MBO6615633.1 hypothetical protein [Gracilimonas sp.]
MNTTIKQILVITIIFGVSAACSNTSTDTQMENEILPEPSALNKAAKKATPNTYDPFADAVAIDGLINNGQGFPFAAGGLDAPQLLNPLKSPPVTGIGGGFVVYDMGEGESIKDQEGPDLIVIEADGSLIASGFGFAEGMTVYASNDPAGPYKLLGSSTGTGLYDLNAAGLSNARYIRIEDTGGVFPSGVDINGLIGVNLESSHLNFSPKKLRSDKKASIKAHVQLPGNDSIIEAAIILATYNGQPSPTPPPYYTDLNIAGNVKGNGSVIDFDSQEFFSEVPTGDEIIIGLELISDQGNTYYLFDIVSVE